ncbi:MAG: hypothetical protein JW881_08335 [Spirochaetales bacterium]|nr:hypothetical protein [Spirochaetales bacterium]
MFYKKGIPIGTKTLRAVIGIAFLLAVSGTALHADNKGIALQYFEQAELLYNSGKTNEAEKLLLNSLQFFPNFSESCYLLAVIYLKEQKTTMEGLDYLDKAITGNSWVKRSPSLAGREEGAVFYRIGRYRQARDILLGVKNVRIEDAVVYLLLAKTYAALGDEARLINILVEGEKRFPDETEFYLLHADYYKKKGNDTAAVTVINKGLEKMPDNSSLLLRKAKLVDRDEIKAELLARYFETGGTDPEAAIVALRASMDDIDRYVSFFIGNGGTMYIDLLDEFYTLELSEASYSGAFTETVENFSGERVLDSDRNAFFEEKYYYDNGTLTLWEQDRNQDGLLEAMVVFRDGMPHSVTFFDDKDGKKMSVTGTYSTYPYCVSLAYAQDEKKKEYQLLPLSVALRMFDEAVKTDGTGAVKKRFRLRAAKGVGYPPERTAVMNAFRVDEYEGGRPVSAADLLNGKYVVFRHDTDENGTYDYITEYSKGVPSFGRRDLDGDGIYEIEEVYKKGKLDKIIYNHDSDNHPDCIQYYSADFTLYETHWDYNSDGRIDAKEVRKEKGKTEYLFSTRYNGKFDLDVVFVGDKLVRMERNGRRLSVQPGRTKGVYWIGKKGREFEVELRESAGIYHNNGKIYFIFRYNDNIYIEVVE